MVAADAAQPAWPRGHRSAVRYAAGSSAPRPRPTRGRVDRTPPPPRSGTAGPRSVSPTARPPSRGDTARCGSPPCGGRTTRAHRRRPWWTGDRGPAHQSVPRRGRRAAGASGRSVHPDGRSLRRREQTAAPEHHQQRMRHLGGRRLQSEHGGARRGAKRALAARAHRKRCRLRVWPVRTVAAYPPRDTGGRSVSGPGQRSTSADLLTPASLWIRVTTANHARIVRPPGAGHAGGPRRGTFSVTPRSVMWGS